MVERIESKRLDSFEGVVKSVEFETSELGEDNRTQRQYHIKIDPTNVVVGGATHLIHEWIRLSPKATEMAVQFGSVIDRYLTHVEIVVPEAKGMKTVEESLKTMIGKKFRFNKLKLGREFEGQPAKDYWVPVARL
jgi:hypothetical protein